MISPPFVPALEKKEEIPAGKNFEEQMLLQGQILKGKFRIGSPLGKGGQVRVYLAEDLTLPNRSIIIKQHLSQSTVSLKEIEEGIHLFRQEAEILGSIAHPSCPKFYEYFEEAGQHYIVEEYVPGKTLEAILKETGGVLPEKEVGKIALQMLLLLDYLHSLDPPVVIRDIKPSNIILNPDGRIFFIDFTIAKRCSPGKADTVRMGSPGYAPPEQYSGSTDPRSDLFSLGVTLHQLLTGYDPVATPFSIPSPSSIKSSISIFWSLVLEKATKLDPEDRYQSAREMIRDMVPLLPELRDFLRRERYIP